MKLTELLLAELDREVERSRRVLQEAPAGQYDWKPHEKSMIFGYLANMVATICVALDPNGFIKTGPDLSHEDLSAARWPLARPPHLLETSLPGVFAVGDARCGNIKRVASAVGEGSIAISFVHQVLHE